MMTSTKVLVMKKTGNNEGRKPLPVREGVNFYEKYLHRNAENR